MYDEEIEKAVLYYIIFEGKDLDISEKDFVNNRNQIIAKAILDLRKQKQKISILTIQNKIKGYRQSDVMTYISSLGDNTLGTDCDVLFNKLKSLTKKREVLNLSLNIQQRINDEENIEDFIESQIKTLNKINQESTDEIEDFKEQLIETSNFIEKQMSKQKDNSLMLPFYDMNELTNGLHNEELTIIGARPRCW